MNGTDIELLRREMDTLWGTDLYGRPSHSQPLVALAVAGGSRCVRLSPSLPVEVRRRLDQLDLQEAESSPEALIERFRELLPFAASGYGGGPSYVFDGERTPEPTNPELRILSSEESDIEFLRTARPEPWWEAEEWDDFLAGRIGPWAVGVREGRVAALCHTPVASSVAAEAGVWTHPDERGRGWAGLVTSEWARVAGKEFETLFYSTRFDNVASQAVARKLGLRPIGAIWQLHAADPQAQT